MKLKDAVFNILFILENESVGNISPLHLQIENRFLFKINVL